MPHVASALSIVAGLFVTMLVFVEIGRRMGRAQKPGGIASTEGAIFGLMGLLIAFTFGSAAVRFETRRNLINEEANDIGTAYLRLDLLPTAAQPKVREAFRHYVDTRLEIYRTLRDADAASAAQARMTEEQNSIWKDSVAGCGETASASACMLLLPALNAMIDISSTRTVALQMHQPTLVFVMLAISMVASALVAGFDMESGTRSWPHVICFAVVVTIAYFVILDLEYPRLGLIRIDWMDEVLRNVRASMGP
jgi:hypothetical protein